jgi:hypothetical protein
LKRRSASSLEVMKLSSALHCVTPCRTMWSLRVGQRSGDENCS